MAEHSKAGLLKFLDHTAEKGLTKKATAQSLKAACNTVLSILDDDEEVDILSLDLDGVFRRFENKRSMDFNPTTLGVYKRRVRYARDEFRRYLEDPSGWKPSGGQRRSRTTRQLAKNGEKPGQAIESQGQLVDRVALEEMVASIVHQFPLRRDAIVSISGIPFDVTKSEMGRMTAFLSNLVVGSEDTEPVQLMLNASDEIPG
jgi:hypothetical protein